MTVRKIPRSKVKPEGEIELERRKKLVHRTRVIRKVQSVGPVKRKILCLSDMHIPFWDKKLVMEVVKEHSDADICVINGDLMDHYSVSKFVRDKYIALIAEYREAEDFVNNVLAKTFDKVIITKGNHELRLETALCRRMQDTLLWLVEMDLLHKIAEGHKFDPDGDLIEVSPAGNVYYPRGEEPFWTLVGKTVFVHPLDYRAAAMSTAVMANTYFADRMVDFDSLVLSHTHATGCVWSSGRMLMETGCLCLPMDYEKQGKLKYGPQKQGYVVIYQDAQGRTDFVKSQVVYLGMVYEDKEGIK